MSAAVNICQAVRKKTRTRKSAAGNQKAETAADLCKVGHSGHSMKLQLLKLKQHVVV